MFIFAFWIHTLYPCPPFLFFLFFSWNKKTKWILLPKNVNRICCRTVILIIKNNFLYHYSASCWNSTNLFLKIPMDESDKNWIRNKIWFSNIKRVLFFLWWLIKLRWSGWSLSFFYSWINFRRNREQIILYPCPRFLFFLFIFI